MPAGGIEAERVRWRLRHGLEPRALEETLRRALAQARAAQNLKSGRRKALYPLDLAGLGATDHLLKVNRYPAARGWLRGGGPGRRSKARRELAVAERLGELGLPAKLPLAAGEQRRRGRLEACFLLTPYLDGWTDLEQLWRGTHLDAAERRTLATALGELVRGAHAAGLEHDDLIPNNVLVRRGAPPRLQLIDFERARLRRRLSLRRRARALARLARALPGASAPLRLRFLRAYSGDAAAARRWWQTVQRSLPGLAARDHARMRRAASAEGRRFRRVDRPGAHGLARRDAAPEVIARAARAAAEASETERLFVQDGLWLRRYPGASPRHMRELWARANSLSGWGLAPQPVALLFGERGPLLAFECGAAWRVPRPAPAGVASSEQRGAAARLLARLLALGRLEPDLSCAAIALPARGGPAALVAPEVFRFHRRGADPASHAAARRVMARLDEGG